MDIELLSKMVAELILDHDSVGLPGVGSFVAEIAPAAFSDRGYTITPPYRRLSFHSGYPEDDILASYYAESNHLEIAEAKAILADYLSQMKEVLKTRKTVIFPGLGRLRATKDNKFFFVADEELDIYPDGLMLEPISLKTHQETAEEVAEAVSRLSRLIADQPIPVTPVPESVPEPVSEPEPDIVPEPLPEPAPEPEAAPAPTAGPDSVPVSEPEPAVEPAPAAPESKTEHHSSHHHHSHHHHHRRRRSFLTILLAVLLAVVFVFALFMILSRLAPDFIDRILYTPEELSIINY